MDEPLATSPDDADHLRALVDAALVPLFGGPPEHDSDNDMPITNGNGLVWVRVLESAPVVQIFSALVYDAVDLERAAFEVGVLNRDLQFLKFMLLDDTVMAYLYVPALPFAPRHLRAMLDLMCRTLNRIDQDLAARVGGTLAFGSETPESAEPDPDDAVHPALQTLVEIDADAPGSVTPEMAAAVCDLDRELILQLVTASNEREQTWTSRTEELLAEGDPEGLAEVCLAECRAAARMTTVLRRALRLVVEQEADRCSSDRRTTGRRAAATAPEAHAGRRPAGARHPRARVVRPVSPTLLPPQPTFTTMSEDKVWRLLRDQLGPDDVLFSGQRISAHDKDHEIDIGIAFADGGIVIAEVKGSQVWCDDGDWWMDRRGRKTRIHPVKQAREAQYALRTWLDRDPRWAGRTDLRWGHAVVLPYTDVNEDFALLDAQRWQVAGRSDLPGLATFLRDVVARQTNNKRLLHQDDLYALVDALNGRGLPQRDLIGEAAEREDTVERLSAEQSVILAAARQLHRVEVRGGAGSGKTWLAVEQARRLSREGQRVALTCYSRGLAAWLERRVAALPRKERPAYVGTFHNLGEQYAERSRRT